MKLADVIGALRRRWYVLVVGVIVAAAAAYGAWTVIPPEYERSASQLLLPGEATIPDDANPYLFVGGLYQVADILVRAIGPDDIAQATADAPGASIAVSRDTAAGAVMLVTVSASSEEDADVVLATALQLIETRLGELQDEQGIPTDERVDLVPLTHDSASVVVQKNRILVTGVVGLVIAMLSVAIAVLGDTLIRLRRRRRSRSEQTPLRATADEVIIDAGAAGSAMEDGEAATSDADRADADSPDVGAPERVVRAEASSAPLADAGEDPDEAVEPDRGDTSATPEGKAVQNMPGGSAGGRPRKGRPVGARRRNWQAPHPAADDDAFVAGPMGPFESEREAG
ncbi:hypothetical protein KZX37_04420 [Microbacterium sp. EYE_5]|uniref:hypothetical protein n=1 Tax=unclassified Microbacterium TaxID=2609290 RepID=UPI0020054869|nr:MULTISPECIES: hypothetical protein [unclassified Microbacterium]MCK6079864.1 hypothetical protein [Microbacterium sp. EYE_382]MCK6085135.1 hypothetical protein [Microbacterium sp. EYE_384]MCK6122639.1 hypothetical protein [Microbacterium sp. EYE_80]MCK6125898.1 hypothetical protein [Microbacterium sp. EYE_79]MCK6140819.1 hypothetical protein [Microbacterium sp. EYE_39]